MRTLSINCITSQAWKFRRFAILSILGRRRGLPTALLCCAAWSCQVMSENKKYDRKNTITKIGELTCSFMAYYYDLHPVSLVWQLGYAALVI